MCVKTEKLSQKLETWLNPNCRSRIILWFFTKLFLAWNESIGLWVRVMVFYATFNNISVISMKSVLLVEETGVPGKTSITYCEHSSLRYTPPLPTSVQPISITKTLLIVPTKNERDPPLFTGKLLIKFQNIPRNTKSSYHTTYCRVKILFSVISSPITLEQQKWKSSKMKGILLSSPVSCW